MYCCVFFNIRIGFLKCQIIYTEVNIDISGSFLHGILDCDVPDGNSGNSLKSVRTYIYIYISALGHIYICNVEAWYAKLHKGGCCVWWKQQNNVDGIFMQECGKMCTAYANNAKFWQPSWFFIPLWKSKLISTNLLRFSILQNIYIT